MTFSIYHNPYNGLSFCQFFGELSRRLWGYLNAIPQEIVSDEIQVLVLMGIAVSSSLVGSFLVLRKMTMLANSLSHTILLGIVLAYFFTPRGHMDVFLGEFSNQSMLIYSLLAGLLTVFLTQFFTQGLRLQEDASIGLVFTSIFALGILSVTVFTRNAHIGLEAIMGNVDALRLEDIKLVYFILGANLCVFILFFKEFKISTFDPNLAQILGISVVFFNYLLMVQVSATTVSAFRAVGVLMVLSFITAPPLTARLLTHRLHYVLILSGLIGIVGSLIGVALSRHILTKHGLSLSTSGIVVSVLTLFYLTVAIWKLLQARQFFNVSQTKML